MNPPFSKPRFDLSSEEMLEISEQISCLYHPSTINYPINLAIIPVDPYHLYAYWKHGGSLLTEQEMENGVELVLRTYWRPDETEDANNTKLWFDTVVSQTLHKMKIQVPVDNSNYQVMLAKRNSGHTIRTVALSNLVRVPRAKMTPPKPLKFTKSSSLASPSNTSSHKTDTGNTVFYDEQLIHNKIIAAMRDRGFVENIDHMLCPDLAMAQNETANDFSDLSHPTQSKDKIRDILLVNSVIEDRPNSSLLPNSHFVTRNQSGKGLAK